MVEPGEIIAGKYRVERTLGKGAMGVVVSTLHLELGARRAIKLMRATEALDQEQEQRFLREARATVDLKSQHTVRVIDVGRLDSGDPYIVMEHLEGRDFRHVLKERGRIPWQEAVLYVLQICEALVEAHDRGIVHRDLKPANLFLAAGVGGAPCVKVLDFGIAKLMPQHGEEMQMTSTGALIGTPYYMSPEQIQSSRDVDPRTDIWSLGVILYQLVTGRLPFEADGIAALMDAVRTRAPTPPATLEPELPAGLEAIILRCLEKDPRRRFQRVAELAQALASFAPEQGPRSLPGLRPGAAAAEVDAVTQRMSASPLSGAEGRTAEQTPEAQTNATWAALTGKAPARPSRRLGLVGAALLVALAAGIAAFIALRTRTDPAAEPAAATPTSEPTAAAPTEEIPAASAPASQGSTPLDEPAPATAQAREPAPEAARTSAAKATIAAPPPKDPAAPPAAPPREPPAAGAPVAATPTSEPARTPTTPPAAEPPPAPAPTQAEPEPPRLGTSRR